jgi:hypothetical protein
MRVRPKEMKKGEVHWARSKAKKRRAGGRQAAAGSRQRAWQLGRAAARRVRARRSQRGWASSGRASWGARWRRKSTEEIVGSRGKMPAMGGAAEKQRGGSMRKKTRTCS